MDVRHFAVALAVCAACVGTCVGACAGEHARVDASTPATSVATLAREAAPVRRAPASAGELRRAESTLAAYLDASRETAAHTDADARAALDSLLGCDARGTFVLPISLLAAYRVLPASGGGDTLLGRAVVATVAEQRQDHRNTSRFLARQRVQVDTLEWDLVRDESGAGWQVCNGLQFGFHEPEDATTWYPLGASRATARALADSIHRAWGAASPHDVK